MSTEVVKHETKLPEVPEASDLLNVIAHAVSNPALDVVKMQALLDMHMQLVADRRREAFDEAMTRLQAKLPHIVKYGQGKNSKFAKYEDLDLIVRPLLAEEGFSVSFNEAERTENHTTFMLEVSRAGHSKQHRMTVHNDKASMNRDGRSIRPAIQDDGSTASYARRYLLKLALNIVETDEDTDGESREPITEEQARDLYTLLTEVKADKARFLAYMGVETIEDIMKCDHVKAVTALESKRRKS